MATPDGYSRFIAALKVALPLAALAILATLFLVAEKLDPEAAIPYADVDVEQLVREQGITRPSFGGTTTDGSTISLRAQTVRPDPDQDASFIGTDLNAEIVLPGGTEITIQSPQGYVEDDRTISLSGGARLVSSTGWIVTTDSLSANLRDVAAETAGEVLATGPAGDVTAGRMILNDDGGYHLVFTDGVRLVYKPAER